MRLNPPAFWHVPTPTIASNILLPLSWITGHLTRKRQKRPSLKLPIPVLCCGNITVGGTGKTPLALAILTKLIQRGARPHAITRGYGGRSQKNGLIRPEIDHAIDIGDEAMLLARLAPTWRGPDRKANALNAIAAGAECLILDDGLQDPALHKDISLLTLDGPAGLGNQRLLPAGPLREALADALPRLDGAVLFGKDEHGVAKLLPPTLPVIRASLTPDPMIETLQGQALIAFTGIGRPGKFFTTLREAGLTISRALSFPDHYIYTAADLTHLAGLARENGARLVTTEKDSVKLPPDFRQAVEVITITPRWDDPTQIDRLLDHFLAGRAYKA